MAKKIGQRGAGSKRLGLAAYGQRAGAHASRGSAASRGYGSRWQKARRTLLSREPLCVVSDKLHARVELAEVIDHFYPASGLSWLFWDRRYWVPMTKALHDGWKQAIEIEGEAALDAAALSLGLPPLSVAEPERVAEWRVAFAERRGFD